MKLDVRVGREREQFASQTSSIPPHIEQWFQQSFIGDETEDFNEGLLAGFASAYSILEMLPLTDGKQLIGSTIALLAHRI